MTTDEAQFIAPLWARLLIIPIMLLMAGGGLFMIVFAIHESLKDFAPVFLLTFIFGVFCWVLVYRGYDLVRFRNVQACLVGDTLIVKSHPKAAPQQIGISELEIIDHPVLKLAHVDRRGERRRVMSIDYQYPHGMELAVQLFQKVEQTMEDHE